MPPDQVRDLWEHWGRPDDMIWYQGSHVTFPLDPRVRLMAKDVLRRTLLAE